MNGSPKAILFDLDGTLFDRDATVGGIAAWQATAFAHVIPKDRAEGFRHTICDLDAHGHRDKREVYARVGDQFALTPSDTELLLKSFWTEYGNHCRAGEGVVETLTTLREEGIRLGIITNGVERVQNAAIDAIGVRAFMEVILISETEGVRKPDSAIFRRATERLGLRPEQCWFVGDHPEVDVEGAEHAGLKGVWKRTPYWSPTREVVTIDSLGELQGMVESSQGE